MTPRFANLPDYILGVTREIREGRQIASLHQANGQSMVARPTLGVMIGVEDVIRDMLAAQAAFPDRQVLGDDGIWSGKAADGCASSRDGFYPCRVWPLGAAPRIHFLGPGFHLETDPSAPS